MKLHSFSSYWLLQHLASCKFNAYFSLYDVILLSRLSDDEFSLSLENEVWYFEASGFKALVDLEFKLFVLQDVSFWSDSKLLTLLYD
jgi:hypothetical protein